MTPLTGKLTPLNIGEVKTTKPIGTSPLGRLLATA